jgi:hypothetical protein
MKNDNNNFETSKKNDRSKEVITRKQALQKAGLLTLTTASMLLLMKSPAKAATSTPAPPSAW